MQPPSRHPSQYHSTQTLRCYTKLQQNLITHIEFPHRATANHSSNGAMVARKTSTIVEWLVHVISWGWGFEPLLECDFAFLFCILYHFCFVFSYPAFFWPASCKCRGKGLPLIGDTEFRVKSVVGGGVNAPLEIEFTEIAELSTTSCRHRGPILTGNPHTILFYPSHCSW